MQVAARAHVIIIVCACVSVCFMCIPTRECVCVYVVYVYGCVSVPSTIGRVSALTRATRSAAHIAAVRLYYNIVIVVRTRFFVFNRRRRRAYDDNANEVDTIPTALL